MNKPPTNALVLTYVLGTMLAGLIAYAAWHWVDKRLNLPDAIFFVAYAITVPTAGFYRAIKWGYWLAKMEHEGKQW